MLPKNGTLRTCAQELRNQATQEERHLWYDFLCKRKERWNRQKVIGRFIVDFFCFQAMLVIELDGAQHYTEDGLQYDLERTAYLEGQGLTVLRFTNLEVRNHFPGVCDAIALTVEARMRE